MYFEGLPRQFMKKMQTEVRMVDRRKSARPDHFSRPRMPAAAPAKHDDRNLTFKSDELAMTFWGYILCALACSVVDMVVRRSHHSSSPVVVADAVYVIFHVIARRKRPTARKLRTMDGRSSDFSFFLAN